MQSHSPEFVQFMPIFIFIFVFIMAFLINILLVVWPFCKIFSKAGYHWALGILMIVPIANIVMPFVLAFGDWPVLQQKQKDAPAKTAPLPLE